MAVSTLVRTPSVRHAPVPAPGPTGPSAPRMDRRLGIIAIVLSATAMGTAGLFGRMATPSGAVIGEALTLGRMLFGAVAMLLVLVVSGRVGLVFRTRLSWSVVLGGVFLGLSLATYLSATVLTSLSLAVVLHLTGPALATVMARVVLKERPTRIAVVSLGISVLGMVLAAGLSTERPAAGEGQLLGIVLGAVSGVLYGASLHCYRYRGDMPADVRSLWNFVFGSLGAGAMVAVTRPDLSAMTPTNWAWAGAFFAVCGLFALGLLVVAGKHLRSAELSALSYWEVVVAVLVGAAVFGETISVLAALGAVLIVVAAVLPFVTGRSRRREVRAPSR